MPVFRIASDLFYFAHVPKCAGTAVEQYLRARFAPLGFVDSDFFREPERWTRSSPQHVTVRDFERLMPLKFFKASFAVVRHPATRLRSVFLFQRDIEKRLAPEQCFESWLEGIETAEPYALDNHILPMVDLVPKRARVFQLEAGLNPLIKWLDKQDGAARDPREMPVVNVYARQAAKAQTSGALPELTPAACARIATLYADDFSRFGYDPSVIPDQTTDKGQA
jgi:hypothetical protein